MKYMRDNIENKYGIVELQDKILEIAVYIDEFCRRYGIEYCLMGGSALGAKRHGGFIPWDDDLDIFMTPENYEKFRECFNKYGDKEKFYLQQTGLRKNGMVTVPKLRMNGTTYIEELTNGWDIHQGIFVDIFILHRCPECKLARLWQFFWAKCVVVKGMSIRGYSRQKGLRKFLLEVSKIFPKWLMIDFALKQVYRYRNKQTSLCCNFLGKAVYNRGIYNMEWFEKLEKIPFEKTELCTPVGLDCFLTKRFGNYMIIPSEDRIKWEQHALKWDTRTDFSVYLPLDNRDFSDESNLV